MGQVNGFVTALNRKGTRALKYQLVQGLGIAFGPDVTRNWCNLNGVTGIIRSHEVRQSTFSILFRPFKIKWVSDGYEVEHDGLCTTVRFLEVKVVVLERAEPCRIGFLSTKLRGSGGQPRCLCKCYLTILFDS